jgi:diguanylate cyclase (GGDEF)-like protein
VPVAASGGWWLVAAVAVLTAVPLALADVPAGIRLGAVVLAVGVVCAGLRGPAGKVAVALAPVAVVGVGLAGGEDFWPNRVPYLVLAACSLLAAGAAATLRDRIEHLRSRVNELAEKAEARAIRDAVEEALTHRRADNYVDREIVRAHRYGREVTVAIASIDNLQLVRQRSGPTAAREALARLGGLFSDDSRLPDGGVGEDLDLVFVLPETPLLGGRVVAERVRLGFQSLQLRGADDVPLTVSVGVATYPADGQRSDGVLDAARSALARAQSRGGNRTMLSRSPAGTPAGWSGADA